MQLPTLILTFVACCIPAFAATTSAPTFNLALDIDAWSARADGGHAPSIAQESSIQITGKPALRLVYRDQVPHFGNVERTITIPPTTRAISIRLYKHSASKDSDMYIWLFEPDGDCWSQRILINDDSLGHASDGWHDFEVPIGQFTYDPRGDHKPKISKCNKLLIGFTTANADLSIAEARFVLSGESAPESPAVLPPPTPEKGIKGRIAILSENFVKRRVDLDKAIVPTAIIKSDETEDSNNGSPSASDPEYLAELATRSGYGVTLLSASALSSPGYLSPNHFDLLVIPSAPYYPLNATKPIQTFLAAGGNLFTTGGYAFDKPCVRSGDAWLTVRESLTVEDVDAGKRSKGLNHRYGIPADGQGPEPGQIPLFDPLNPLKAVEYAQPVVSWIPNTKIEGPFEGWAASAMLGSNNPVFPKSYARWIPLLMGYDTLGRKRGTLGAIIHNFNGPYKGSSWAAFGVTNADLFSRAGALAIEFPDIVDRIVHKVYLRNLKTDLFLYKPGEPVKMSVVCSNFDSAPATAILRFEITNRSGIPVSNIDPVEREVPAGFEERIEIVWDPPASRLDDFFRVRCRMSVGDREDEIESAFCLDNPKQRVAGFQLSMKDNYLQSAGTSRFWLGTNQTGAMFSSDFEDPLVWDRDLATMRSNGLSIMRVLHFSPFVAGDTPKQQLGPLELPSDKLPRSIERKLDALVQLTAQHNIVLFLTLHDWMNVDLTDEELKAQEKFAKLISSRYADCPHVMYDIQNEPTITLDRPKEDTELWNRFLTERYKTQQGISTAWGTYLNNEKLGAISIDIGKKDWTNLRAADRGWFRTWLFNRWVAANMRGIAEGSKALATVGLIQHPEAADQLLGNEFSSFANKHYYGDKASLPHQIKLIDRRFEGKGFSLGEFGSVVDHNARISGQTTTGADADWFIEAAGCTMGMGGMFALNWCWKEMPDNVFPWGINTPCDNIPRETLLGFRAFSLATHDFQPKYSSPEVFICIPDNLRQGIGEADVYRAIFRAIDAMISQSIPFGIINETNLTELPPTVKAVIAPIPISFSDTGYGLLKKFVQRGGVLLVTGDISFDLDRKRTKTSRLTELFGLEFLTELQPPMTVGANSPDKPAASIEIKPAGASVVGPSLWMNVYGKGKALFTPVPWELLQEPVELYAQVLASAKLAVPTYESTNPKLIVYSVPGVAPGDQFLFIQNRADTAQQIALPAGLDFTIKKDEKTLVVVKAGKPASLIASGKISIAGKRWADFAVPTMVTSLDSKPLNQSARLAICPLGTGAIQIHRLPGSEATIWVGETEENRWLALAQRPVQKAEDMLLITAETALRFSLITVSSAEDASAAGEAIATRLTTP